MDKDKVEETINKIACEAKSLVTAAIAAGKDPLKLVICYGCSIKKPWVTQIWLEEKQ